MVTCSRQKVNVSKVGKIMADDDWDFSLDDENLDKKKEEEKEDNKKAKSTLRKARNKNSKKLQLDKKSGGSFREGRRKQYEDTVSSRSVKLYPAGVENRLTAFVIDLIIPLVGGYLGPQYLAKDLAPLFGELLQIDSADPQYLYNQTYPFMALSIGFIIYLLMSLIPLSRGTSLGLKMKKLRLNHIDGGTLSISSVLLRQLIGLPINIVSIIGVVFPLLNKNKRTLHDFLFKSICEKDV